MTTATTSVRPGRRALVLLGVGLLSFLGCIDLTIVNTAAPAISGDLGSTIAQTQLIVNVFVVALAMFMVTAGRLSDRFGRRRVLLTGAVVFGLASLGAGLSGDVAALVVFRFAQGAAGAVLYTGCTTVVADSVVPEQRGRAIGALFAINGVGLAVGPLLGGVIVAGLGWPWVFLINVPLVAVAIVACLVSVPRSAPAPDVHADVPGALLLAIGLAGVIAAFTLAPAYGWTSGLVLACAVTGALALVAFPLVERRRADPLIPFGLLTHQLFRAAVVAEAGLAAFYTTALFLMPLYLTIVRGLGELTVGLAMLPATATVAVVSPIAGRVVDRFGPRRVLVGGFAAFTVSGVVQSRLTAGTPWFVLVLAFVVMGVGWAFVLGPSAVTALAAVPAEQAGLAVGTTWTAHNVGGAVGLAVSMTVFRLVSGAGGTGAGGTGGSADRLSTDVFLHGFSAAMLLIAATSALAAVTVTRLTRRR